MDFNKTLESFFNNDVKHFANALDDISSDIKTSDTYEPELQQRLDKEDAWIASCCRKVEDAIVENLNSDSEPDIIKTAKNTYRKNIYPWYSKSFFMHRSTVKPRGYPGDSETIEGIYNNVYL